jgi:hypothetical protein
MVSALASVQGEMASAVSTKSTEPATRSLAPGVYSGTNDVASSNDPSPSVVHKLASLLVLKPDNVNV